MTAALPNTPMSDPKPHTLKAVLTRLTTHPRELSRERLELSGDPRTRLDSVLQEIQETVLPRTLILSNSTNEIARLQVANRRVAGLAMIQVDQSDTSSKATDAKHIATGLLTICKELHSIRTTPHETNNETFDAASSVSVADLRGALGLGQGIRGVTKLAQLFKPHASAMATWQGNAERVEFSGDTIWQETLESFTREALAHEPMKGTLLLSQTDQSNGVVIPINEQDCVVLAIETGGGMCCIAPIGDALKLIENWQTLAP